MKNNINNGACMVAVKGESAALGMQTSPFKLVGRVAHYFFITFDKQLGKTKMKSKAEEKEITITKRFLEYMIELIEDKDYDYAISRIRLELRNQEMMKKEEETDS